MKPIQPVATTEGTRTGPNAGSPSETLLAVEVGHECAASAPCGSDHGFPRGTGGGESVGSAPSAPSGVNLPQDGAQENDPAPAPPRPAGEGATAPVYGAGPDRAPAGLPLPRLQLRWVATDDAERWLCHYELAFALRPLDCRHDLPDDVGNRLPNKEPGVAVVQLGITRVGCSEKPWRTADVLHRMPYRDGSHARWDAEALGGLPVYVLTPDHPPALVPALRPATPAAGEDDDRLSAIAETVSRIARERDEARAEVERLRTRYETPGARRSPLHEKGTPSRPCTPPQRPPLPPRKVQHD